MSNEELLRGIKAVVLYSRKDRGAWLAMAAFDLTSVAEQYAKDCSVESSSWEYKVVELAEKGWSWWKGYAMSKNNSTIAAPKLTPKMLEAGREALSIWHRFDSGGIVTDSEAVKEIWAAIWQHAEPSSSSAGQGEG